MTPLAGRVTGTGFGSPGFRVPNRGCICRNLRQSDSSRTRRDAGSRLGIRLLLAILLSPHTREVAGSSPAAPIRNLAVTLGCVPTGRPSASPCNAFEYPACERHLRSAPYVSLLEGPGVDRVAVAHQLEQAWFAELLG
jgi:hypothetical protein